MNNLTLQELREILAVWLTLKATELLNIASERVQNVELDDGIPLSIVLDRYSALLQAQPFQRKEMQGFDYLTKPAVISTSLDIAFADELERQTVSEAIWGIIDVKH